MQQREILFGFVLRLSSAPSPPANQGLCHCRYCDERHWWYSDHDAEVVARHRMSTCVIGSCGIQACAFVSVQQTSWTENLRNVLDHIANGWKCGQHDQGNSVSKYRHTATTELRNQIGLHFLFFYWNLIRIIETRDCSYTATHLFVFAALFDIQSTIDLSCCHCHQFEFGVRTFIVRIC